jgi:hypothetical protein
MSDVGSSSGNDCSGSKMRQSDDDHADHDPAHRRDQGQPGGARGAGGGPGGGGGAGEDHGRLGSDRQAADDRRRLACRRYPGGRQSGL